MTGPAPLYLSVLSALLTPSSLSTPFRQSLLLLGFHGVHILLSFSPSSGSIPQCLSHATQLIQWQTPTLSNCPSCTRAGSHLIQKSVGKRQIPHQGDVEALGRRRRHSGAQRDVGKSLRLFLLLSTIFFCPSIFLLLISCLSSSPPLVLSLFLSLPSCMCGFSCMAPLASLAPAVLPGTGFRIHLAFILPSIPQVSYTH